MFFVQKGGELLVRLAHNAFFAEDIQMALRFHLLLEQEREFSPVGIVGDLQLDDLALDFGVNRDHWFLPKLSLRTSSISAGHTAWT